MNASNPAQPPRDLDVDAARSAVDRDAVRKALNLLVLTLWKYRIERATIVSVAGRVRVEVRGETLADGGWSDVRFTDLHRRLSIMTGVMPPRWLRRLQESRLPWRWVERLEFRLWRPRLPAGEIDFNINNEPVDVRFRAAGAGRIELEVSERPLPSRPAEMANTNH